MKPPQRATPPPAQDVRRGHAPPPASTLAELSVATEGFGGSATSSRRDRRRVSFLCALSVAVLAGAALTFAGRLEKVCAVTFRLSSPGAEMRAALADYARRNEDALARAAIRRGNWFVDQPAADRLRLGVRTTRAQSGLECVRGLGSEFQQQMQDRAAALRNSPTDTERELQSLIAARQAQFADLYRQVESASSALGNDDPSPHRSALLERWQTLREAFLQKRQALHDATVDAARLQNEPAPTYGLVSAEQRQDALHADAALQQDLNELAINLTELKAHLLHVWRRCVEPLDRVSSAADAFLDAVTSDATSTLWNESRGDEPPLLTAAKEYRESLTAFADAWNRRFDTIRQLDVDPYRAGTLNHYELARRQLNDFLFESSRRLAAMRSVLQGLAANPRDNARFHVALSDLTRAFQTAQTAHHRFEFEAGAIEAPENFRIDATTRAARGLQRRSQLRIRTIERALQEKAIARAKVAQAQARILANQQVQRFREAVDETVDELITLQEQLHLTAEQRAEFLRSTMSLELARTRFTITRSYLEELEDRARRLAKDRMAQADATQVQVVSCQIIDSAANLAERIQLGALGAGLTLLAMLFGQWWITRRI